jgi:hypothetical protein
MQRARWMRWWLAVPMGIALGLALAVAIDRAAQPAGAQGGRSGVELSAEQLRINQRISQAAVKRSNRANSRLDKLTSGAAGATGAAGPAGPAGPPGPAGAGATRIAFSAAAGSPTQTILDLAGVTLTAECVAEAGGAAALDVTFGLAQASTFAASITRASGTDPGAPSATEFENVEAALPAGPTLSEGDPVPDGEFLREYVSVLFIAPTRTVSVEASLVTDAAADRCSFNGVAVPAS